MGTKREEWRFWNHDACAIAEKNEAEGNLPEAARRYRKCLELTIGDDWPVVLVRKRLRETEEKLKALAETPAKADGPRARRL